MSKIRPRSSVYKRIWESYHLASLLPGMHIHHIDGNPENNNPLNLLACTPEEHWLIHKNQGDSVAINGKFVQFANYWERLNNEERENRIKLMIKGTKELWEDPVKRENLIKNRTGRKRQDQSKLNISLSRGGKPFKVINPDGSILGTWINMRQCARDLGLSGKSQIWQCLSPKSNRKTCKGYRFEYE